MLELRSVTKLKSTNVPDRGMAQTMEDDGLN